MSVVSVAPPFRSMAFSGDYRVFTDCDITEPASVLVSSAYLSLRKTLDAKSSILAPVCLSPSRCASTDRSGPACLNNISPSFKWTPAGCQRCRVIHGGERRLRRTQSRGGQLGAHQRCHFRQPLPGRAAKQVKSAAVFADRVSKAVSRCCTKQSSRQCQRGPHSRCRKP